jgi:hypothetical protein
MYKLILVLALWVYSANLFADAFRCGRSLVKVGESNNALIKKCGNPARKYTSKERVNEGGRSSTVSVSNWVYGRKGKKDMIVSIRGGTVVKIQVD